MIRTITAGKGDANVGPEAVLDQLREGNRHWASGRLHRAGYTPQRRREAAAGQEPHATVFTCVDSRVPAELVFHAGLGDLLVTRTAASVLDDAATASVVFGPAALDVPLVVVLAHQRCGAVTAAVTAHRTGTPAPDWLAPIEKALRPAYDSAAVATAGAAMAEQEELVNRTAYEHARLTAAALRSHPTLAPRVGAGQLDVVAGWYSLDTGLVEFYR
ncbi:MAG: carbonic anhydrase [Mycobacteriales bacterium]